MGDYFSKLDVLEFDMGKFEDDPPEESKGQTTQPSTDNGGTRASSGAK